MIVDYLALKNACRTATWKREKTSWIVRPRSGEEFRAGCEQQNDGQRNHRRIDIDYEGTARIKR